MNNCNRRQNEENTILDISAECCRDRKENPTNHAKEALGKVS